jgi:hypothetical protein
MVRWFGEPPGKGNRFIEKAVRGIPLFSDLGGNKPELGNENSDISGTARE